MILSDRETNNLYTIEERMKKKKENEMEEVDELFISVWSKNMEVTFSSVTLHDQLQSLLPTPVHISNTSWPVTTSTTNPCAYKQHFMTSYNLYYQPLCTEATLHDQLQP